MSDRVWGQRRATIQHHLRIYLHEAGLSPAQFAKLLKREPGSPATTSDSTIRRFLDPAAGRVRDQVVEAVEAYLEKHVRPHWENGQPAETGPTSSAMLEATKDFFGMGPHKVRQFHRSVPGTYQLFSYSEQEGGNSSVCVGAIRLGEDFGIEELQTSTAGGNTEIREEYFGHYIYRDASVIAMMRNKLGRRPKFYILAIPSHPTNDGTIGSLTGLLLKAGGRPVFGTAIHMIRNDEAFSATSVQPRARIDEKILEVLNSHQWLPYRVAR